MAPPLLMRPPSQSLLSAALAELFKKKYGVALFGAGDEPVWFVKLKESAGRMQEYMNDVHGPWDMCVETLCV